MGGGRRKEGREGEEGEGAHTQPTSEQCLHCQVGEWLESAPSYFKIPEITVAKSWDSKGGLCKLTIPTAACTPRTESCASGLQVICPCRNDPAFSYNRDMDPASQWQVLNEKNKPPTLTNSTLSCVVVGLPRLGCWVRPLATSIQPSLPPKNK